MHRVRPCLQGGIGKFAGIAGPVATSDPWQGIAAGQRTCGQGDARCGTETRIVNQQVLRQVIKQGVSGLPHLSQLGCALKLQPRITEPHGHDANDDQRHQRVDQRKPVPRLWAGGSHLQADSPGCTTERTRPLMAMMSLRLKS